MKVEELIKELKKMPANAEVYSLWDGSPRTRANTVHLARNGKVVIADNDSVVYYNTARPIEAPTELENGFWKTPGIFKRLSFDREDDR